MVHFGSRRLPRSSQDATKSHNGCFVKSTRQPPVRGGPPPHSPAVAGWPTERPHFARALGVRRSFAALESAKISTAARFDRDLHGLARRRRVAETLFGRSN